MKETTNKEYIIQIKNRNDILNEIDFDDNDDFLICESIISNLEKSIATSVKDMKVANIPFIGCVRINPVRHKIKEAHVSFKLARTHLTKEQYKEHVRAFVKDVKEHQEEIDNKRILRKKIKARNKKKYELLYKRLGKSYAEMFITAFTLFKDVPFDEEWEEHYQSLKD